MAINIVDTAKLAADHVESYWATATGSEVENTPPIRIEIDDNVAIIGGDSIGERSTRYLKSRMNVLRRRSTGMSISDCLMAGERVRVAHIVGGAVQRVRTGEADAVDQARTQQRQEESGSQGGGACRDRDG